MDSCSVTVRKTQLSVGLLVRKISPEHTKQPHGQFIGWAIVQLARQPDSVNRRIDLVVQRDGLTPIMAIVAIFITERRPGSI
jgi:hypothetical protein